MTKYCSACSFNLAVSSLLLYVNSLTRPRRPLRIKTWIRVD